MLELLHWQIGTIFLVLDVYHSWLLIFRLDLLNDAKLVEFVLIFYARHPPRQILLLRKWASTLNRSNLSRLNDSSLFFLLSLSQFFLKSRLNLFLCNLWYLAWSPTIFKGWGRISHTPNGLSTSSLACSFILHGLFGFRNIRSFLRRKYLHDYASCNLDEVLILIQTRSYWQFFIWSFITIYLIFRVILHVINKYEIFVPRYFMGNFHG